MALETMWGNAVHETARPDIIDASSEEDDAEVEERYLALMAFKRAVMRKRMSRSRQAPPEQREGAPATRVAQPPSEADMPVEQCIPEAPACCAAPSGLSASSSWGESVCAAAPGQQVAQAQQFSTPASTGLPVQQGWGASVSPSPLFHMTASPSLTASPCLPERAASCTSSWGRTCAGQASFDMTPEMQTEGSNSPILASWGLQRFSLEPSSSFCTGGGYTPPESAMYDDTSATPCTLPSAWGSAAAAHTFSLDDDPSLQPLSPPLESACWGSTAYDS